MSDTDLLSVFETNRNALSEFLKNNCTYDYLKKIFSEMEQTQGYDIIKKIFLGTYGIEINKQKAIYELPTDELLTIIKFICETIDIHTIEELAAGMGLLSCMLKHKLGDNYTINATDGKRWIETLNPAKYYPVSNKLFLQYYFDDNFTFNNKLMLISWAPASELVDLLRLLDAKKPKYLIIIGNNMNKEVYDQIIPNLNQNHYQKVIIPVKQICYKDHMFNDYSKSSVLFATLDNNINITKMLLEIKLNFTNYLMPKHQTIDTDIITDIIIEHFHSYPFLLNNLSSLSRFKKIVEMTSYCLKNKITVPNYFTTLDECCFWYEKIKLKQFPLLISDYKKFCEYREYIQKINSDNGLIDLKNNNILPDWINDIRTGEQFLWLDFSTKHKKWKYNLHSFMMEFSIIRS